MFYAKFDDQPARSKESENRGSTPYVRATIFKADEGFESLVGKRAILWCEGDMDPEDYLGKILEVEADIRDNVQVVGSTQESNVLSNLNILRVVEGDEARGYRREITLAQVANLNARGPRSVIRNATTGTVTAESAAAKILTDAVGHDPAAARAAAGKVLDSDLDDATAMGVAEALLMMGGPATVDLPRHGNQTIHGDGVLAEHKQGNAVIDGMEHHGATVYREQPGVERAGAPIAPTMGTVGGAFVKSAPGDELSQVDDSPL